MAVSLIVLILSLAIVPSQALLHTQALVHSQVLVHSQFVGILLALVLMVISASHIAYILTQCQRRFVILLASKTPLTGLFWQLGELPTLAYNVTV